MTYSIVAFDPDTGEAGVAVQSHWFSVGSLVGWARAGVGAVATQSIVEVAHGPNGLVAMEGGASAQEALDTVLAPDPMAHLRQVGMVDAQGRAASHTGAGCIKAAGHVVGDHHACQANMMTSDGVPEAMDAAYRAAARQPLAERLFAALQAAEDAGGDVRGKQSASLLVVPGDGEPWRTLVDLRVEDHPDPVVELGRLLNHKRAFDLADAGDEALGKGDLTGAGECYRLAMELVPESDELRFWSGLTMYDLGHHDEGLALVRDATKASPGLLTLLERVPAELAPSASVVLTALR